MTAHRCTPARCCAAAGGTRNICNEIVMLHLGPSRPPTRRVSFPLFFVVSIDDGTRRNSGRDHRGVQDKVFEGRCRRSICTDSRQLRKILTRYLSLPPHTTQITCRLP